MFEDPPQHGMHRGLMSRVFTPRAMAELEDQVRKYCIGILDPLVGSGGFDVITELASVMPMRVIGMLLGIPVDDQIAVREKTDSDLRTRRGEPMQVRQEKVANGDMFAEYIDWRAKHPSDDLMTRLLNAEFEDETRRAPHAHTRRSPHVHRGHRGRGQRDDRTAHRLARQAPRRAPRPAS